MKAPITTELNDLNQLIGEISPGDLCLIGGRPNSGKSVFATNIALKACQKQDNPIIYYSISEPNETAFRRLRDCSDSDDKTPVRVPSDISTFLTVKPRNMDNSIFFCDSSDWDIESLIEDIRETQHDTPLSLIVIDYLELVAKFEVDYRVEEQDYKPNDGALKLLKQLAVLLQVPIIVLANLNRMPLQMRDDKRPLLTDMKVSAGGVEHVDTLVLLYRNDLYNERITQNDGLAEMHVLKSKDANTGVATVSFDSDNAKFENIH